MEKLSDTVFLEVNTGMTVPYLFWEADFEEHSIKFDEKQPIYTYNRDTVCRELTEQLLGLGMTHRDVTDMLTFWLNELLLKPYVEVQFMEQSVFNSYAKLTIAPEPKTTVRIFMLFRSVDKMTRENPKLIKNEFNTNEFYVLEWGACNLS
jgi:hypothetical protein